MSDQGMNRTKENIERKRKMRRKRRRVNFFRLLIVLVTAGLLISAALFLGYAVYRWSSNLYHEYQTMYEEYTDRKDARQGAIDPKFEGYTNILILGLDEGVDPVYYGGQNADAIIVMSLENSTGRLRFITIPRDTWVVAPGGQGGRIGTLYKEGGAPFFVRQVSALLGISIHQYIAIDMNTFAELIDLLGGIDIYVEEGMDYDDPESGLSIHLKQGYQHMDGESVQKYLRYRGSDLGDVGRVQRQQRFLKALYEKVLQIGTVPKLPAIAEVFQNRIETSAEIFDSAHLANVLRRLSTESPVTIMLPGNYAPENDTVWIPNHEEIDARIRELFPETEIVGGNGSSE